MEAGNQAVKALHELPAPGERSQTRGSRVWLPVCYWVLSSGLVKDGNWMSVGTTSATSSQTVCARESRYLQLARSSLRLSICHNWRCWSSPLSGYPVTAATIADGSVLPLSASGGEHAHRSSAPFATGSAPLPGKGATAGISFTGVIARRNQVRDSFSVILLMVAGAIWLVARDRSTHDRGAASSSNTDLVHDHARAGRGGSALALWRHQVLPSR